MSVSEITERAQTAFNPYPLSRVGFREIVFCQLHFWRLAFCFFEFKGSTLLQGLWESLVGKQFAKQMYSTSFLAKMQNCFD